MKTMLISTTLAGLVLAAILGRMLAGVAGEGEIYPGMKLFSPDREYVAVFFGMGGGGAVGWLDQYVAVSKATDEFDPSRYLLRMRRGSQVCLRWARDRALIVGYPAEAVIEEKSDRTEAIDGVDVEYEPLPSQNGMLAGDCAGEVASLRGVGKDWEVKE